MCRQRLRCVGVAMAAALLLLSARPAHAQFGVVLSGAGPVNRSMGGASTALPLDATGALYWNPATIGALRRSEVGLGAELLTPRVRVGSAVPAGALGPLGPPVTLSGSDKSENGVSPIPTMGLVWRPDESSAWTFGAGLMVVGGFSVNYPGSATNPILTPQAPAGLGLGAVSAELQVFQFVPTASVELSPGLFVGAAPTLTLARLTADPFFVASPDDANRDGFYSYPMGTHTRYSYGAGFQVGVYYEASPEWNFGASFKSPQWLESFRYQSRDERGVARSEKFHFDYPMMVSVGASYLGIERLALALDLRWIDYKNAEGFDQTGFAPTGAVRGLGWDSVFALAAGAQYQATDCLALRAGYSYNTNPIDSQLTLFNVASPLILKHTVYLGATVRLTDTFSVTAAYAHAFRNSIEGPYLTPQGALPGASVKSELYADSFMLGATVEF